LDLNHPGCTQVEMMWSPEPRRTLTCALSRLTQGPESGTRVTRVSESRDIGADHDAQLFRGFLMCVQVAWAVRWLLKVCLGCGFRYVAVFRSECHTHISVGSVRSVSSTLSCVDTPVRAAPFWPVSVRRSIDEFMNTIARTSRRFVFVH